MFKSKKNIVTAVLKIDGFRIVKEGKKDIKVLIRMNLLFIDKEQ